MTDTQSETPVGKRFGRYTLLRPIGRGGMAEVWKAKIHGAQNFQRLVVVKRILPHLSSDPEFVGMFTAEAMLSAQLNHPNIVQVFEFSEVEGEHYLAMEFVQGINVGEILKQLGRVPVPLGMAAHIVREVSSALDYAHALTDEDGRPLSIIHRDVSPSNVMIGFDGAVKLVDFGVAKALRQSGEDTRTGALKGKVSYMSPEAVDGEFELDGRTDIFAAGVLLFELLTGRRLFKGQDDLKTIALIRTCKVDPPSQFRDDVPPELDRIVKKALERDRDARYQTAGALAADLTQVVNPLQWDVGKNARFLRSRGLRAPLPGDSQPVLAPMPLRDSSPETLKVTVVERKRPSSTSLPVLSPGRWRWVAGLGGLGAIVALSAGFGGWWPFSAPERQPMPRTPALAAPGGPVSRPAGVPSAPSTASPAPSGAASAAAAPASADGAATETPVGTLAPGASMARASRKRDEATPLRPGRVRRTGEAGRGARPRRAPAPEIDLRRGDVLRTF